MPFLHASTVLPPFAPRPLRRFFATMEALTPGQLSPAIQVSLLSVLGLPDHSVSTHPVCSHRRFIMLPLSSLGLPFSQVQASPFPSRLARRTKPYRVRHPADWSFTSRCSHPTSRSPFGFRPESAFLKGTFTPLTAHAHRCTRGKSPSPYHNPIVHESSIL